MVGLISFFQFFENYMLPFRIKSNVIRFSKFKHLNLNYNGIRYTANYMKLLMAIWNCRHFGHGHDFQVHLGLDCLLPILSVIIYTVAYSNSKMNGCIGIICHAPNVL